MEPAIDHLCGSACMTKHVKMLKKARKHNFATRKFWTDGRKMTNTANLCQILGGLRKSSFTTMKSHWKTIPTLQPDKKEVGTRNHGNFHCMHRVYKDHSISAVTLNRRSRHAKTVPRAYSNHWRNKPVPPEQQVRKRRNQQFERHEEYAYRLDASSGWRYYPSSTTHSSSSSSSLW